ncbi:MAG: von Willebrand factor type A domain-containing protein [Planctomycetes bacterium]|nr:von Willebrand factor type A domain-containing protein [Planctomycetota bacterium]
MKDHDPIIEAALEEALGGKTPPDLIAQTLAKAGAEAALPKQPVAGPRPAWRAWGPGLAAAAAIVLVIGIGALASFATMGGVEEAAPETSAKHAGNSAGATGLADVTVGPEDSAGGQLDRPVGGVTFTSDGFELGVTTRSQFRLQYEPDNPPKPEPEGMKFSANGSNPFVDTEDDRLSTFGLEHDTGSYTIVRGYLNGGNLPPAEAVRVEEFVNYFDYGYIKPAIDPFSITMDAAPSRYGADLANCYLLRVGLQAREISAANRKPAVLTFVIDVSGSMSGDERLGLVQRGLKLLVEQLREGDKVGIAVFGSRGYQYMDYKDAWQKDEILAAIDRLSTEGSTNAEEGLKVGYQMATAAYKEGWTNRVILCSDGVANVGATQAQGILNTVVEHRRKGITLSTLGFGMGNYNDTLMEQLGDKGDGHYAYVDSIDEAKRIFVDNLTGALEVVGRDVKIQIEFNPDVVKSYRLLGYVNRDIKDEDFRNDKLDGGEISAGHAATALYEIKLYEGHTGPIGYATIRYKEDELQEPIEISQEVFTTQVASNWESADKGLRLAGNVAEFAEILAKGFYAKNGNLDAVLEDLRNLQQEFRNDKVDELIELVKKAAELKK